VSIAEYNQLFAFPVASFLVFAISALAVFVLKKTPLVKWLF